MARYRKKPVVVEAFQWRSDNGRLEFPEWVIEAIERDDIWFHIDLRSGMVDNNTLMRIRTPKGLMTSFPGDYIIRGFKGGIYPCKPDIFAAKYEAVEEPETNDAWKRHVE